MKILHSLAIFFSLILHFHHSTPYSLPDSYFINCGSASTSTINGRNFTGDTNSRLLSVSGKSTVLTNPNPSTPDSPLYQTARQFNNPSTYTFQIRQTGYYMVRFHFYPFLSLSDAQFNVSVSGFTLLHNFNVQNSQDSPIIKEFLLRITLPEFKIYFTPINSSSFAFVNAIEAFITPENFIPNVTVRPVSSANADDSGIKDILSHVLHTIHRINFGGPNLTPDADTLLRKWVADDYYLYSKDTARNSTVLPSKPKYQPVGADEFTAPDNVYQTAKQLNRDINQTTNILFNMTWRFNVTENASHFVRAHFCDIVSKTQNLGRLNYFIDGNLGQVFSPTGRFPQLAAPFYIDLAVESDDSGFMNVSIGPDINSDYFDFIPFINGLEIMEVMTDLPKFVSTGSTDDNKNRTVVIIGSCVGAAAALILLLAVLFWFKCKKAKPVDKFDQQMALVIGGISYGGISSRTGNGTPRPNLNLGLKLNLEEILCATNNFDPKLMIGEGGFGKVYKGILKNGTKVAVKRSEPGHGQGLYEFQTEIMVLSKIRYIHLVSLIGYCDERSEMILVYEFMEKGTFREHLYGSDKYTKLSWNKRVEICIGAAKGIHYLHTCLDGGIIHRDVKSTNILLDENYKAKVADFGLSRLGLPDQTAVSTEVKGSFGYLDPEYFRCLQLTQKSDVYSFGVVLLEVLCGRPAICQSAPHDEVNLSDWGIYWQKKGELERIVDPFLAGKIAPTSLTKFGETVEKCLRENGVERPSMIDVMWDLEYVFQLQQTNSVVRGKYEEDSVNDESWGQLALPLINNVLDSYSLSIEVEEDEVNEGSIDASSANASGSVFSQLKVDDAR